jgi:hypothetical protein
MFIIYKINLYIVIDKDEIIGKINISFFIANIPVLAQTIVNKIGKMDELKYL